MTYKIGEMSHIREHKFCWYIFSRFLVVMENEKITREIYYRKIYWRMKQGRVIINMKKYTPLQPVKWCFIPFFLLITSVISMEIIVGNQLTLFLHSCLTLIILSLIFSMRLWKSTSIHRLLYTPGKDYVIETNGSNCPIIPSSPYQPIIITHTRLSILVDWR